MIRMLLGISLTLALHTATMGQCDEAARALRLAQSSRIQAASIQRQAESLLEVFETLEKFGGISSKDISAAKEALAQAEQALAAADTGLDSAESALSGCEEETEETRLEEERRIQESIPIPELTIAFRLSARSAVIRDRGRADNPDAMPTYEVIVSAKGLPDFSYQLQQSVDLISWQSESAIFKPLQESMLEWSLPLLAGNARRDVGQAAPKGGQDAFVNGLTFLRVFVEPTEESGQRGRVRGR